jgi:RES domain-containing protein
MVEIVCYRAAAYRTPLRVREHRRSAAGGRFHRPGSPPTQYLALHPLTPWAETVRGLECRAVEDALEVRMPYWAVRLVLDDPPPILDFDAASTGEHGIGPEELIADDSRACQALAERWRNHPDAPKVFRVPSAALPGTENLVILGPRKAIEYTRTPRRALHVPASVCSVDGTFARALFPFIRHRGEPHDGYDAWTRGEEFRPPPVEPVESEATPRRI